MASQKKCKECGTKNEKINKVCSNCNAPLYKNVRYSIAIKATIVLDIIMMIVYIASIFVLMNTTSNINMNNISYIQNLPMYGSVAYYALIIFFIINAIVKVLFILNHFVLKTQKLIFIRRIFMFVEAVFMFPFQSILALYFYNPATKENK